MSRLHGKWLQSPMQRSRRTPKTWVFKVWISTLLTTNEIPTSSPIYSELEFLICIGLLVGAPEYGVKGTSLWQNDNGKKIDSNWLSTMPHPNFDRYIPEYHFRHFREFLPLIYQDNSVKDTDPWWQFSGAVKEFNNNWLLLVKGAKVKAVDESMCAYHPQTTSTGGLPNRSFIKRKPEPLGTFTFFSTNKFILF